MDQPDQDFHAKTLRSRTLWQACFEDQMAAARGLGITRRPQPLTHDDLHALQQFGFDNLIDGDAVLDRSRLQ